MPYIVLVDDNFHDQDRDERHEHGRVDDAAAALAACRRLVDAYLAAAWHAGLTAEELWDNYRMFGDDPFIVCADVPDVAFSAWDYARSRCPAVCDRDADVDA